MNMKAVVFENGRIVIREVPRPRRRRGEALVRVLVAGICNTDLELLRGYYRFSGIAGHEFVGEVVDADDGELIGRQVVGEINIACLRCDWCRKGLSRHCPRRTVLGIVGHAGAFAEYITLPEGNLWPVPRAVSVEEAVFTEPLAAAFEILEQLPSGKLKHAVVVGDGKLGLLIVQVLALNGTAVELYGRHRKKMRIVAPLGVKGKVVGERVPRDKYEVVIDATGSTEGFQTALQMVCPMGYLILKSTIHDPVPLDTGRFVVNEVTLIGSRCGPFKPALKLLRTKRLILRPMIHGVYPLEKAPEAFQHAAEPGTLKILLVPDKETYKQLTAAYSGS